MKLGDDSMVSMTDCAHARKVFRFENRLCVAISRGRAAFEKHDGRMWIKLCLRQAGIAWKTGARNQATRNHRRRNALDASRSAERL